MNKAMSGNPETGLIVSILVGLLTASGIVDQAHADQLVQLANAIGSVVIISVGLLSYFEHKTQVKKAEIQNGVQPAGTPPAVTTTTTTEVGN